MVAKGIAPAKREFLCSPPIRSDDRDKANDDVSGPLVKEKKSKRQLKRESQQGNKSTLHICSKVAKSASVDSCPYGDKCHISHDLEAFKLQKSEDLEGICPFLSDEGPCPYGLGCRLASTHRDDTINVATGTIVE